MSPQPVNIRHSDQQPVIEAPLHHVRQDSIDCGITAMNWCNTPACQRFATVRQFTAVLCAVGLLQGMLERYFRLSVLQAADQFDYQPLVVDWLLVSAGLAQGLLALAIAYWANRIHRMAWLGSLVMLQAIAGFAIVVPVLSHSGPSTDADVPVGSADALRAPTVDMLCTVRTLAQLTGDLAYGDTTLAMMFVLQLLAGAGHVAFYALGFSYVRDHAAGGAHAAALLGCAFACRVWGPQIGMLLAALVASTGLGWWLGWTMVVPLLFAVGLLVSLFPRRPLRTVVRSAASDIVRAADDGRPTAAPFLSDVGLGHSLRRVLTNRVLMCNGLAGALVLCALLNYADRERDYVRAAFLVPVDDFDAFGWSLERQWPHLVRPLVGAVVVLMAGLLIGRVRPTARRLAGWSAATGCLAIALFVGFVFLDCPRGTGDAQTDGALDAPPTVLAGGYGIRLTQPFCSRSCLCDPNIRFAPVCPAGGRQTFFSPCHAGCAAMLEVNGVRVFTGCSCGPDAHAALDWADGVATDGACAADDCRTALLTYRMLSVALVAVLASAWLGRLMVALACVLPQDRALALAVQLTLVGGLAYAAGHAGFVALADITCEYWSPVSSVLDNAEVCQMHAAPAFTTALNIVAAVLLLLAVFFDVLVAAFAGDLDVYDGDGDDASNGTYRLVPLQLQPFDQPAQNGANPNVVRFERIDVPLPAAAPNATPQPSPTASNSLSVSERMRLSQLASEAAAVSDGAASPTSSDDAYARVRRSQPRSPQTELIRQLAAVTADLNAAGLRAERGASEATIAQTDSDAEVAHHLGGDRAASLGSGSPRADRQARGERGRWAKVETDF